MSLGWGMDEASSRVWAPTIRFKTLVNELNANMTLTNNSN